MEVRKEEMTRRRPLREPVEANWEGLGGAEADLGPLGDSQSLKQTLLVTEDEDAQDRGFQQRRERLQPQEPPAPLQNSVPTDPATSSGRKPQLACTTVWPLQYHVPHYCILLCLNVQKGTGTCAQAHHAVAINFLNGQLLLLLL